MATVERQSSVVEDYRFRPRGCFVAGVAILAVLIVAATLALREFRNTSKRIICTTNMKWIGQALHNYHSVNGCFPPAYTVDANGRPMHSWRTLLLPYLESASPYDSYNLDVAWDHPANSTAVEMPYGKFVCPADSVAWRDGPRTNYVMVHGPGLFFDPARDQPTRSEGIPDHPYMTLMVVETTQAVRWAAPDDPIRLSAPPDSGHPGGLNVLTGDGSVRFWKSDIPHAVYRAALTIAGGEVIPSDDF